MATTRARLVTRSAALADDFGLSYATRLFGAEALADLPRFSRGKNAGKLKGYITWVKAESGGWSRQYGVCYPGLVRAWIAPGYAASEGSAYTGMFLGRVQLLCASVSLLGDKNRAAWMAQQTVARADDEARWAEHKAEMAERNQQ
jgi:hypothetical protein